jgi:hypothetical protein
MPSSCTLLVDEWRARNLNSYRLLDFAANRSLQQAYNKRRYMYDASLARMRRDSLANPRAGAASLDRERGGRTLPKFYQTLKNADITVTRRAKKRARVDVTPPPLPPPPPPVPPRAPRSVGRRPWYHRVQVNPYNQPPPGGWPAPNFPRRVPHYDDTRTPEYRGNNNVTWEETGHTSHGRDHR